MKLSKDEELHRRNEYLEKVVKGFEEHQKPQEFEKANVCQTFEESKII